jgi:hypothetical protein
VAQSKPLKTLRRIPVHRQYIDVIERNHVKVARERFDPLRVVVSHSNTFGQIKHSVRSILPFITSVSGEISFVWL